MPGMLRVAFAGTFAATLEPAVRARLTVPCEIVLGDEAGIVRSTWYRYPTAAEPTPPARRPFHQLPNVLMTPHVSGWTDGMLEARARLIADNVERLARGEPLTNLIAP